ncbi:MAG: O-antigen ligase family protein [bacterium]
MGFFLFLLYLSASYIRPSEQFTELADAHIIEAIAIVALPAAFLSFAITPGKSVARIPHVYLLAAFLVVVTASPIIAQGWLGGGWLALDQFFTSIAILILIVCNVNSVRRLAVTAAVIILLSLALVAQAALAVHAGYRAELLTMTQTVAPENDFGPEPDPILRARGLGYLNDPNDLAQALIAVAPLLWPFWGRRRSIRNFIVVILPTAALIYGVFLTRSRGGMIAIVILAALRIYESTKRFRLVMPALIAVVLVAVMLAGGFTGGRELNATADESVASRFDAWAAGLTMLKTHPLFGVGYGAFDDFHTLTAHNSFVLCFAELGLAGYVIWMALLLSSHSSLALVRRSAGKDAALARWARASMFSLYGFVCSGFFLSRTYSPTLYLVLGMCVAVAAIAKAEGYQVVAPFRSTAVQTAAGVVASVALIYAMVRVHTAISL